VKKAYLRQKQKFELLALNFHESSQMFPESRQMFPESHQMFPGWSAGVGEEGILAAEAEI
jgi:hypothetical protein